MKINIEEVKITLPVGVYTKWIVRYKRHWWNDTQYLETEQNVPALFDTYDAAAKAAEGLKEIYK